MKMVDSTGFLTKFIKKPKRTVRGIIVLLEWKKLGTYNSNLQSNSLVLVLVKKISLTCQPKWWSVRRLHHQRRTPTTTSPARAEWGGPRRRTPRGSRGTPGCLNDRYRQTAPRERHTCNSQCGRGPAALDKPRKCCQYNLSVVCDLYGIETNVNMYSSADWTI